MLKIFHQSSKIKVRRSVREEGIDLQKVADNDEIAS